MNSIIINILLGCVTVVMIIIPLFADAVDRHDVVFDKPFIKKITPAGWAMIGCGFLLFGLGVWKYFIDEESKLADNNKIVNQMTNHFDIALKKYDLAYDRKKGAVVERDSVIVIQPAPPAKEKPYENPELNVAYSPVYYKTERPDSFDMKFSFRNTKSGEAYIASTEIIHIGWDGNTYNVLSREDHPRSQSVIQPDGYLNFIVFFIVNPNVIQRFLYVRVNYKNRKGKMMPSARKIFHLLKPADGKENYSADANYDEIKAFMQDQKLW